MDGPTMRKFYVYALKTGMLHSCYSDGERLGSLVYTLRSHGWTVYYRKARLR